MSWMEFADMRKMFADGCRSDLLSAGRVIRLTILTAAYRFTAITNVTV